MNYVYPGGWLYMIMTIGNDGILPHHETCPQSHTIPSVQPIRSKIYLGLRLNSLSPSHGLPHPQTTIYKCTCIRRSPTTSKVALGNYRSGCLTEWPYNEVPFTVIYIYSCIFCTPFLVSLPIPTHQRTAEEVQSLLAQSEEMLSQCHFASAELRDRAWDLNSLHNNFESRLRVRRKVLNDTVTFYRNADEVRTCVYVYRCMYIILLSIRVD